MICGVSVFEMGRRRRWISEAPRNVSDSACSDLPDQVVIYTKTPKWNVGVESRLRAKRIILGISRG